MGHEEVEVSIDIDICGLNSHARFRNTHHVDRTTHGDCFICETQIFFLNPKLIWRSVIGDVDIGRTIKIEVTKDHPKPIAVCSTQPCRFGDVLELASTQIFEQTIRCRSVVVVGGAVIGTKSCSALQFFLGTPKDVLGDVQLGQAITIEIAKSS